MHVSLFCRPQIELLSTLQHYTYDVFENGENQITFSGRVSCQISVSIISTFSQEPEGNLILMIKCRTGPGFGPRHAWQYWGLPSHWTVSRENGSIADMQATFYNVVQTPVRESILFPCWKCLLALSKLNKIIYIWRHSRRWNQICLYLNLECSLQRSSQPGLGTFADHPACWWRYCRQATQLQVETTCFNA